MLCFCLFQELLEHCIASVSNRDVCSCSQYLMNQSTARYVLVQLYDKDKGTDDDFLGRYLQTEPFYIWVLLNVGHFKMLIIFRVLFCFHRCQGNRGATAIFVLFCLNYFLHVLHEFASQNS